MHSLDMWGTNEQFGACNLRPNGVGSNKPRSQKHLHMCHTCWWGFCFLQEINPERPCRPPNLTENPWSLHELERAVARMKIYKGADEAGLVIAFEEFARWFPSRPTFVQWHSLHWNMSTILEQDVVFSLRCWRRWRGLNDHLTSNPLKRSVCCIKPLPSWFFLPSHLFAAIRSQRPVVPCLQGSFQALDVGFIRASLQMCKVQGQSPLTNQRGCGGRWLESAGSGGSCARRSLRGGARHRDADGRSGPRKGGWLQML